MIKKDSMINGKGCRQDSRLLEEICTVYLLVPNSWINPEILGLENGPRIAIPNPDRMYFKAHV